MAQQAAGAKRKTRTRSGRKWLVIVPVLVAACAALVASALQDPIYSASAEVVIRPGSGEAVAVDDAGTDTSAAAQAEAAVVESDEVRVRVQDDLGLTGPPPEASASVVDTTGVISISVRDESAENSAILANAYAEAYLEVRLEQLAGDADAATGGAVIVTRATTPENPTEPTPARDAAVAAAVGLVIGLMMVVIVDLLDDKVLTEGDLHDHTGLRVLGNVSELRGSAADLVIVTDPESDAADGYRRLTANLLGLAPRLTMVQIVSAGAIDGSTTTAANVAVILSRGGYKAALVDANLRDPHLHSRLGLDQSPGLTDVLDGSQPADVVHRVDLGGPASLAVYTAGAAPDNPTETLLSTRVARLFRSMSAHYDIVVVDSAAVDESPDALALASLADGVLMVVDAGEVTGKQLDASVHRMNMASANVIGAVLNHVENSVTAVPDEPDVPDESIDESSSLAGEVGADSDSDVRDDDLATEPVGRIPTDPLVASQRSESDTDSASDEG